MITFERVDEMLDYCPKSGELQWKGTKPRCVKAGASAGCLKPNGYLYIGIDGKHYLAHRLAWLLTHGAFPENDIDHIDGVRTNNQLMNLRAATRRQNTCNSKVRRDNASGTKGICWHPGKNYWRATIQIDGETREKYSRSKDVVIDWLLTKREQFHGEFANHG